VETLFPNIAKAKRNDPVTSHEAADKLNKGDNLKKAQREALQMLSRHNGNTAKDIGIRTAWMHHGGNYATWETVKSIIRISKVPQKRMSELVALGYAEIKVVNKKRLCYITDAGREKLKLVNMKLNNNTI